MNEYHQLRTIYFRQLKIFKKHCETFAKRKSVSNKLLFSTFYLLMLISFFTQFSCVLFFCLAAVANARPQPEHGHFDGGFDDGFVDHGHGHGLGHGHGHGVGHGHGGYSKTHVGHTQFLGSETHVKVSHPSITTNIHLHSKPFPVKVPIEIPIVQHIPAPKTFKRIQTIKVPLHITKTIPFEVIKTVKVPVKVHADHGGYAEDIHHDGGFGGHGDFVGGYGH